MGEANWTPPPLTLVPPPPNPPSPRSTREKALYGHKKDHKNILNMIDSVNILSMQGATLLMLNWEKYHIFEDYCKSKKVESWLRTKKETMLQTRWRTKEPRHMEKPPSSSDVSTTKGRSSSATL